MTGTRAIRAAVSRSRGEPIRVEEIGLSPAGPREVEVRVVAAGVCHSDVLLVDGDLGDGRWPIVPGHEGAGVVEAVGDDVRHVSPGEHVAFCLVPSCGSCRFCREGRRTMCEVAWSVDGTLLDGTSRMSLADGTSIRHFLCISCFAERVVVPEASLVSIPSALPWQHAALLGCGAVTGSGAVRNAAGVRPGESVCVVGCGGVGLHVLLAARRAGADPIVGIDVDDSKLERATAKGATHVLRGDDPDVASVALALVPDGFDHAFDVAGRPDAIRLAFDVLRPGATAIVVGISPADAEVSLPAQEFLSEKAIRGSFYGSGDPARELADLAARALADPADLEGMVSHVTDLDGLEEAFDRLRRGEGARTIVFPDPAMA